MEATPSAEELLRADPSWERRDGMFSTSCILLVILYSKSGRLRENQNGDRHLAANFYIPLSLPQIFLAVGVDIGSETLPRSHPS